MTDARRGLRGIEDRMWPGFFLVATGVAALWWHRSAADETMLVATIVFYAVPVLLVAGILLLLRALKFKEEALKDAETDSRVSKRPRR